MALMKPGDTFMGLDLACGGHLTHGAPVNMSGKWFNVVSYKVRESASSSTWTEVASLAREHRPKVIVAGGSAYSRHWDFARFREIADEVGRSSWSTSRTSRGSWPAARIPRPSRTPMS
jgi:glycine hydroxymethyltransferase